jgi:asparagine synthetase B (glutamine-hydrolysing)
LTKQKKQQLALVLLGQITILSSLAAAAWTSILEPCITGKSQWLMLPFAAVYSLFQACRQRGLTVVLTGEGGDELLGGYYWHQGDAIVRPFLRLPYPLRIMLAASPIVRSRGEAGIRMGRILHDAPSAIHTRYQAWMSTGDPNVLGTRCFPQK